MTVAGRMCYRTDGDQYAEYNQKTVKIIVDRRALIATVLFGTLEVTHNAKTNAS